jgi:hypothetical protein
VRPQPVPYAFGVPRYLFGTAARSLLSFIRSGWRRDGDPEKIFTSELPLWDLAGFIYGKYFLRTSKPAAAPAPAPAAASGSASV